MKIPPAGALAAQADRVQSDATLRVLPLPTTTSFVLFHSCHKARAIPHGLAEPATVRW